MLSPKNFDDHLNALRAIEHRMSGYNKNTPISKVLADQKKAQAIYNKLAKTIRKISDGH